MVVRRSLRALRGRLVVWPGLAFLAAAACGPAPEGGAADEPCDTPGTYLLEEGRSCYCTEAGTKVCVGPVPDENDDGDPIDVFTIPSQHLVRAVFVVDPSEGMAAIQRNLAAAVDALVDGLAEHGMGLAATVISADAGTVGDACEPPAQPAGTAVYESCRARLDAFADDGTLADPKAACTDVCDLDTLPEVRDPVDGSVFPGVIARADGQGTPDPAAALACAIPLGNTGCRFAQPMAALEAFRRDPPALFHGGERPDVAIVVTDGTECSTRAPEIYDPAGARTFFDDPNAAEASEAVCWNAGVACTGDPSGYDACTPVDLDADGQPAPASQAVLESVEDAPGLYDPDAAFLYGIYSQLVLLAGYDPDDPSGPLTLGEGTDAAFAAEHGIGPSCEAGGIRATPPVRLTAFGEAFDLGSAMDTLHGSVCADDLAGTMEALAARMGALRTWCLTPCPYDADPDAAGIQPVCHFETTDLDGSGTVTLPPCGEAPGAAGIPEGAFACVRTLFGEAAKEACYGVTPEAMAIRIEVSSAVLDAYPFGIGVIANCLQGRYDDTATCNPQVLVENPAG